MIRALVTGASGFVGQYLVRHLAATGRAVFAASYSTEAPPSCAYQAFMLDLTDPNSVEAAVKGAQPDEIYHLAAIASPIGGDPRAYVQVNVEGTLNLLLASETHAPASKVLVVTSGLVYGECRERPAEEGDALRPLGSYAGSKAAADLLVGSLTGGLQVLRVRPFNHTGPGQSSNYLVSSLARQVAEITLGQRPPRIELGNLDSLRDFCDVRDVVEAYRLVMEKGVSGEAYNVCAGKVLSVEDLARKILDVRGVSAEIVSVPVRRRESDIQVLAGNPSKLEQLGWTRRVPLETTFAELVSYWEAALTDRSDCLR